VVADDRTYEQIADELIDRVLGKAKKGNAGATGPEWLHICIKSENGNPVANLANALLALRNDPDFAGMFAFDEMLCAALLLRPLEEDADFKPRPVTDIDVGLVQERLQKLGLTRLSKDCAHQAVDIVAQENAFHPVRDYLNALTWDDTPRLVSWLTTYLGAERSAYTDQIGTMFLTPWWRAFSSPAARPTTCLSLKDRRAS
jgi:predicted P-loop ATPase